jgi:hypothetical protein
MARFTPAWILIICLASVSALHAQELTKPLGKWERKIGKSHVTLIVEDNRLHIRFASGDVSGSAHADYAMTRDGVLFGIVTSLECDDEDKEADGIKEFYNAPFSFRFRIDEGALVISDAKTVNADSKNDEQLNGRFKPVGSATRAPVVPTSYHYSTPQVLQPNPPPANWHNSSSMTPPEQIFNFWTGYMR